VNTGRFCFLNLNTSRSTQISDSTFAGDLFLFFLLLKAIQKFGRSGFIGISLFKLEKISSIFFNNEFLGYWNFS